MVLGSITPRLDAAAPDETRSPYRIQADSGNWVVPKGDSIGAQDRAIAALLRERPAWLELEAGIVDDPRLRRVPVGPTLLLGFGGSALGSRAAIEFAEVAGLRPGPIRILDSIDTWLVGDTLE